MLLGAAACGADPAACAFGGRWQGYVAGGPWTGVTIVQHFDPDGTYRLDVRDTSFTGAWSLSGDLLSIADGSCVTAAAGAFQLKFYDACATVIYHTVDDPCTSRGDTLNGITITQPFM